jgi:hypothetical protein
VFCWETGREDAAITVTVDAIGGLGSAALEEAAAISEGRYAQSEDDGECQC